jgi:hypothetical protein
MSLACYPLYTRFQPSEVAKSVGLGRHRRRCEESHLGREDGLENGLKKQKARLSAGLRREKLTANARMAEEPSFERSLVEPLKSVKYETEILNAALSYLFSVAYGKNGEFSTECQFLSADPMP